jgi:class 3 adenylate cyclase
MLSISTNLAIRAVFLVLLILVLLPVVIWVRLSDIEDARTVLDVDAVGSEIELAAQSIEGDLALARDSALTLLRWVQQYLVVQGVTSAGLMTSTVLDGLGSAFRDEFCLSGVDFVPAARVEIVAATNGGLSSYGFALSCTQLNSSSSGVARVLRMTFGSRAQGQAIPLLFSATNESYVMDLSRAVTEPLDVSNVGAALRRSLLAPSFLVDALASIYLPTVVVSESQTIMGTAFSVGIHLPTSQLLSRLRALSDGALWSVVLNASTSWGIGPTTPNASTSGGLLAVQEPAVEAKTQFCASLVTGAAKQSCYLDSMASLPQPIEADILGVAGSLTSTILSPTASGKAYIGQRGSVGSNFLAAATINLTRRSNQLSLSQATAPAILVANYYFQASQSISYRPSAQFTLAAALFFIAIGGILNVFTRRFLLQELHSLQRSMEGVMNLDFSGTHREERKSKHLGPFGFVEVNDLRQGFVQTANTIAIVTRYIPKEVVKDMLAAGNLNNREMTSKRITVIFVDIHGFSKLCDVLETQDVVTLAEKYFTMTTRILVQHGCTIDKYIGDAVMGFWGAPLDFQNQGYSAICCSLHILSQSKRLAADFDEVNHPLVLRIGVSRGQCAVGTLGSDERMSYTALGDTVNLASRLQMLNSFYKTNLIVSEDVLEHAKSTKFSDPQVEKFSCADLFVARRLGLVRVKGRGAPVAVFNVLGVRKSAAAKLQMLAASSGGPLSPGGAAVRSPQTGTGNSQLQISSCNASSQESSFEHRSSKASVIFLDAHSEAVTHMSGGDSSHEKNTKSHATGTGQGSSKETGSTNSREKASQLSVSEEVYSLRGRFLDEPACELSEQMTKAILHFENMRFEDAVAIYNSVLDNKRDILEALGLDIPLLTRQVGGWQILIQHPPPRDSFDPCENMTTK